MTAQNANTQTLLCVFCSIVSLYRGSFNASIGLDEASCTGQEVPSGISPRAE